MTYHRVCNYINTTGATSGAGTGYPSGTPEFTPSLCGVRVTRSLVLYVCFVDRCLSFCTFSFGHCVVFSSSIYGFWLCLWYLQTLLSKIIFGYLLWHYRLFFFPLRKLSEIGWNVKDKSKTLTFAMTYVTFLTHLRLHNQPHPLVWTVFTSRTL